MGKDPAFLFYVGDWMGGTHWMTFEQKGCYMELLTLQFNTYQFTESQAKQVLSICFDLAWPVLKQKFIKDGEYYYNKKLRDEVEKRKNFTESRRINGLGVKINSKKPKKTPKHMPKHMEDENVNENIIKKGVVLPFDSENFKEAWDYWKKYKKEEFRFNYKSEISEQGSLTELDNMSGHDEVKAIEIIKQSIKKGWKGFFELNNKKGNSLISDDFKQETYNNLKNIKI